MSRQALIFRYFYVKSGEPPPNFFALKIKKRRSTFGQLSRYFKIQKDRLTTDLRIFQTVSCCRRYPKSDRSVKLRSRTWIADFWWDSDDTAHALTSS